eukprot:Skav222611  [mRNA]  locus=scaffold1190:32830:34429:+ [translate_table: standard]
MVLVLGPAGLSVLGPGSPFAADTKLCGMHRLSPAGPSTSEGTCLAESECGVELATGNVGCFSNSTCTWAGQVHAWKSWPWPLFG